METDLAPPLVCELSQYFALFLVLVDYTKIKMRHQVNDFARVLSKLMYL